MAHKLHLLIAAACIAILTGQALGELSHCSTANWGVETDFKFDLPVVYLSPNIADWTIKIPVPPLCPEVVGAFAVGCDYDVAPVLNFAEKLVLLVHRNGDLKEQADVEVTLYCRQVSLKAVPK